MRTDAYAIVVTTYFPDASRVDVALETIRSWSHNLDEATAIEMIIFDDCSPLEHFQRFLDRLPLSWPDPVNVRRSRRPAGVGNSLSQAFDAAFSLDLAVLYAVDDWVADGPVDVSRWLPLLGEDGWGCIRLGPPHPELRGRVKMTVPGWLLDCEPYGYAVSFRPALWHRSFFDRLPPFARDVSALEAEDRMNTAWAELVKGVRPRVGCVMASPFTPHPASETLSALNPKDRKHGLG